MKSLVSSPSTHIHGDESHHPQAGKREVGEEPHWAGLLPQTEAAGVPQAEGGDDGLWAERGLAVAVPGDAVLPVPVQVAEQRVEGASRSRFYGFPKLDQHWVPLEPEGFREKSFTIYVSGMVLGS